MGECNKDFEKTMQSFSGFMNALFEANNEKKAEKSKVKTIKNIIVEEGEVCVDVNMLHDTLAKLPAEIYLKLYHKMQEKVLGYPPYFCGCGAPITEEEKTE